MLTDFENTVASGEASIKEIGVGKFDAKLVTFDDQTKGVLKFKAFGTDKFKGVSKAEMPKREVAVYRLDRDILRFNIVPETLLIKVNGREASIQKFETGFEARDLVPGIFDKSKADWKVKVAKLFTMVNTKDVMKIVILDMIVNNADRHARNVVIDTVNKQVWAIDNGLSFGPYYYRYRNIFHKYMLLRNFPVPDDIIRLLRGITMDDLEKCLGQFVGPGEMMQTFYRIKFILDHKDHLDFWTVAHGQMDRNSFPSYRSWFLKQFQPNPELLSPIVDLTHMPGWAGSKP